ncbi:DUF397 domain-containing protein [Embleya scabrispora]|uniref:DUF397 domain-containing protein n=1 Tax=Embleya scabrispora TaxID=159449 RepID=UPI000382A139|nr:DUF397 domain-containing protein [Embleya scabrispora]MYS87700.1 DUF397 domain-containing protein [Streptomyces sp. SID5474]
MTLAIGTDTVLVWRKSTFSGANDDCVETAPTAMAVAVRDSKDLTVGNFAVPNHSWARLTEALKR